MRALTAARLIYGSLLLLAPGVLVAELPHRRIDRRTRLVARTLGVRNLVEAAVLSRRHSQTWLLAGAATAEAYDCCVHYRREIHVAAAAGPTFAYLSDFGNAAEWDPGIVEARRLTPAPTVVGSRFELIALFRGRRQRFEYVVTEFVEGTHIALHGEGEKALSDDVISVTSHEGGTHVAYEADLRLKGVYRVAEPFLRSTFERMGDAALDGLAARLARAG